MKIIIDKSIKQILKNNFNIDINFVEVDVLFHEFDKSVKEKSFYKDIIEYILKKRNKKRKVGNWEIADYIRKEFQKRKIQIMDNDDFTSKWFVK